MVIHKAYTVVAALFGFLSMGYGQSMLPDFVDTSERVGMRLTLHGRGELASNSLPNSFSNRILLGGFISDEVKDAIDRKSKEINRVGIDLQQEIRWENNARTFGKHDQYGWFVQGGNYIIGGANYHADLLQLALRGNQSFQGDTSFFSGSSLEYVSFQKLGFGIIHRKSDIQLAVNLVSVSSFARSVVREGWAAFDEQDDSLSLLLNGGFYANTPQFFAGLGMAIDYSMRIPFQLGRKQSFFRLDFKNIGFAQTGNTSYYRIDSSYRYAGFSLDQLSGETGVFRDNFSVMDSLGISKRTGRKWFMLPGFVQIGKAVDVHDPSRWQAVYGIRLYTTLNAIPMIYAGAFFRLAPKWWTSASVVYGGFSNLRGGLQVGYQGDRSRISLGTEDVFGLISQQGLTRSVQVRLQWNW